MTRRSGNETSRGCCDAFICRQPGGNGMARPIAGRFRPRAPPARLVVSADQRPAAQNRPVGRGLAPCNNFSLARPCHQALLPEHEGGARCQLSIHHFNVADFSKGF